jgi:hypothetical protein
VGQPTHDIGKGEILALIHGSRSGWTVTPQHVSISLFFGLVKFGIWSMTVCRSARSFEALGSTYNIRIAVNFWISSDVRSSGEVGGITSDVAVLWILYPD